jgi:hypothetical protein
MLQTDSAIGASQLLLFECNLTAASPSSEPPYSKSNAARDRDSSNWTAWWSELNSNFRAV